MPQVRSYPLLVLVLFTGLLMLSGCSDNSTTAVFDPDSGHPSGWIASHPSFALPDAGDCTNCHGTDLGG
ncbi:MAG: cytochrome C, partial [Deltaproteobacteria bacterium]|nr:cytochrome C [Deltaproteobacteria bacterium]NIS78229.1 cytochrome C [Deltaproteobacteria bacterium]